jgi:hypothetical protein
VTRTPLTAAAALLFVSACPLPQPLPDYQTGTTTPPRIVMDGLIGRQTIVRVPAGCPTEPVYTLKDAAEGAAGVFLHDPNTAEQVVARWFVDYDADDLLHQVPQHSDQVPPPDSGAADPTRRSVPAFEYHAYGYPDPIADAAPSAAGVLHVVELVVSAGFADPGDPPNRAPASGFETQTFRWVFMTVPQSATAICPP